MRTKRVRTLYEDNNNKFNTKIMKTILTIFAFLFASLLNVNAETASANQVRINDVPAQILIKQDTNKTFNVSVKSDDNVISNLIKVIDNKNGEWVVELNRPIEGDEENKIFTAANIVISVTTPYNPSNVKLIEGRNISLSSNNKK